MVTLCPLSLSPIQRHTAQLREELLKLPCPEGLEPDGEEFSDKSAALVVKELPNQDAEKPSGSEDGTCSEGPLWVPPLLAPLHPKPRPLLLTTITIVIK